MFETRRLRYRVLLQILLTVLVIPFVFPLVAMIQGSLAGAGWANYLTVLSLPLLPGFFINSALISAAVIGAGRGAMEPRVSRVIWSILLILRGGPGAMRHAINIE